MTETTPRYVVEPGVDGSWVIVDRAGRTIERLSEEPTARREAGALARLGDLTAGRPAPVSDDGFETVFAAAFEYGQAVDTVHNFDHLLRTRP